MSGSGGASDERPEQGWQLSDAAERLHALGIARRTDGSAVVVVPRDAAGDEARALGQLSDGPDRPAARVVTSRFSAAEVRRLLEALAKRDWSPTGEQYFYGFHYDARLDGISLTTNAPAAERALIAERFGDSVRITYAPGGGRR